LCSPTFAIEQRVPDPRKLLFARSNFRIPCDVRKGSVPTRMLARERLPRGNPGRCLWTLLCWIGIVLSQLYEVVLMTGTGRRLGAALPSTFHETFGLLKQLRYARPKTTHHAESYRVFVHSSPTYIQPSALERERMKPNGPAPPFPVDPTKGKTGKMEIRQTQKT